MKFYAIRNSVNNKIVGDYNQVVTAIHHCDVWENPKFIDRIDFVKIGFEPIISNAVLEKKAKLTDLINANCIGFGLRLLISDKLKHILEKESVNKCQFFKSPVIFQNNKIDNYWLLHPFKFDMEYVDFPKSKISVRVKKDGGGTEIKNLSINSENEFINSLSFHKERMEIISITNIRLNDNVNEDFLILRHLEGGIKYIVSETLKEQIELSDCTGIEFQPIGLSLNEWLMPNGEREKIYGKI